MVGAHSKWLPQSKKFSLPENCGYFLYQFTLEDLKAFVRPNYIKLITSVFYHPAMNKLV